MVDPNLVRLAEAYSTALAKMAAVAGPSTEAAPVEDTPDAQAEQDSAPGVPAVDGGLSEDEEEVAELSTRRHRSTVRASELPGLYKSRVAPGDEDPAEASSPSEDSDSSDGEPGKFVRADAVMQSGQAEAAQTGSQRSMVASLARPGKQKQEPGGKRSAAKKRHSLPGRLRKKLAKEKGKER